MASWTPVSLRRPSTKSRARESDRASRARPSQKVNAMKTPASAINALKRTRKRTKRRTRRTKEIDAMIEIPTTPKTEGL